MPEVTDVEIYAGTAAPFNFNGLVRHYFLRSGPAVADLQVNLLPKHDRDRARAIRSRASCASGWRRSPPAAAPASRSSRCRPGRRCSRRWSPRSTAPTAERRIELAGRVKEIFESTPGVVDVDWFVEAASAPPRADRRPREGGARRDLSGRPWCAPLRVALAGAEAGLLRDESAREPVPLRLRLARNQRTAAADLLRLDLPGAGGAMVPLGELVRVEETVREPFLYHKNLQPVTYVVGDVAGAEESPVYAIARHGPGDRRARGPARRGRSPCSRRRCPRARTGYAVKWDGEWQITYEMFRDMGIAFAAVLVLIYAAGGGLVPELRHAARHHGADPADADRRSCRRTPSAGRSSPPPR